MILSECNRYHKLQYQLYAAHHCVIQPAALTIGNFNPASAAKVLFRSYGLSES